MFQKGLWLFPGGDCAGQLFVKPKPECPSTGKQPPYVLIRWHGIWLITMRYWDMLSAFPLERAQRVTAPTNAHCPHSSRFGGGRGTGPLSEYKWALSGNANRQVGHDRRLLGCSLCACLEEASLCLLSTGLPKLRPCIQPVSCY